MRRSTHRETGRTFDWLPYWWGNRFNKRRMAKIVRRMKEASGDE